MDGGRVPSRVPMLVVGRQARVRADRCEHAAPPRLRRLIVSELSRRDRRNKRYPRGCSTVVAIDKDGFDELAVPLDLLLTRPVFGLADRIAPNLSWRRFAVNLARQPRVVASRATTLGRELGAIAAGRPASA